MLSGFSFKTIIKYQCYVSTRKIKTFLMSVFRLHKSEKFSLLFVVFQSLLTILPHEQNILNECLWEYRAATNYSLFVLPMSFLYWKLG